MVRPWVTIATHLGIANLYLIVDKIKLLVLNWTLDQILAALKRPFTMTRSQMIAILAQSWKRSQHGSNGIQRLAKTRIGRYQLEEWTQFRPSLPAMIQCNNAKKLRFFLLQKKGVSVLEDCSGNDPQRLIWLLVVSTQPGLYNWLLTHSWSEDVSFDNQSDQDSIKEAQRPSHLRRATNSDELRCRQIEPQRNWLAKLFNVKPASRFICFAVSKNRARQEITTILKEWKRYGIRDVQVDKGRNVVFARVAAKNCESFHDSECFPKRV